MNIILDVVQGTQPIDILTFLGILLGASAGIWKIWEVVVNTNAKLKEKKQDQQTLLAQAEIDENKTFQEKIVYKVLEQYIEQDKWIRTQFADKFEVILRELNEQNKINKDISSQVEVFRRELRSFNDNNKSELKNILSILTAEQRIKSYIERRNITVPIQVDNSNQ